MARRQVEQALVARKLAVQLSAAITESGKRIVLLTSPNQGDGKTFFIRLVAPELERIAPHRFRVLSTADLENTNPWHAEDDRVLLVDGPAMLEGDGFLRLRKGWVSAFDGALILVMGRRTRAEDLEETASWLQAAKIEPIGIVWNENVCPPIVTRLRMVLEKLRHPLRLIPRKLKRSSLSRDLTR